MSYKIDPKVIDQVLDEFGIKEPVEILAAEMPVCPRCGEVHHRGVTRFTDHHEIVLAEQLSVEQANETLLHELTHAHQRELGGPEFNVAYDVANHQVGYDDNPFERHAREVAEATKDKFKVVIPDGVDANA